MKRCRPVFLVLLSFLLLSVSCSDRAPSSKGNDSTVRGRGTSENVSAAQLRALGEFESEQAERDQLIWAKEFEARRYERVVSELWDRLLRSDRRLEMLREFPIESVRWKKRGIADGLQHDIERFRFDGETLSFGASEWASRLDGWIRDGWVLEFQECRQSGFQLDEGEGVHSVFDFSAHLRRDDDEVPWRGILRGKLSVTWDSVTRGESPSIRAIEFQEGEWLSRKGVPVFTEVVSREMNPHPETRFIDPVIIADFDQNGRSDLLFSGNNTVYLGMEGGGLRSSNFVEGLQPMVYTSLFADVNGDANPEYLVVDRSGVLVYEMGSESRTFVRTWTAPDRLLNSSVLTAGDIDGDGDLDLWLAQYKMPYVAGQMPTPFYDANDGFPSYLLLNDGRGQFSDVTVDRGLGEMRFRRTYSCSFIDLDGDQDLDLLNISDFAGVDVFRNDGAGSFREETSEFVDVKYGFGMAHAFGDFDQSGALDWIMIGMNSSVADRLDSMGLWPDKGSEEISFRKQMAFGNRLYLADGTQYRESDLGLGLARSGWSWGAGSADFDNDGDLDLYVANGHKTRASSRDYEEQFWCHDLFVASSEEDPVLNLHFRKVGTELYGAGYSYGGHQRNAFFLNIDGKEFVEVAYLLGVADDEDGRNVLCEDLDGDGFVDILVTSSQVWPKGRQSFRLYQNVVDGKGGWIGLKTPIRSDEGLWMGATVRVQTAEQSFVRVITSGDGYRTQSAGPLHFGLGEGAVVRDVNVTLSNGQRIQFGALETGRYHSLQGK